MPGWQALYEELKDKNFEIIAVAQDTGGEEAAGRFYDGAKATYTALIDVDHTISSLYDMVNVPTAVWIDEEGNIVRQNEGAYSKMYKMGTTEFGTDEFVPAIRDWVENGSESIYAMTPEEVTAKRKPRTTEVALADPVFKLGVYFHLEGDEALANKYWEQAQALNPDSWNYHRQDWSFTPSEAMGNWMKKAQALGDKPYYEPMDLPADAAGE